MLNLNKTLTLCLLLLVWSKGTAQVTIQTDFTQAPVPISPTLMGAFFEDINYAADGGLYAELIQNRSFEYYPVAGYTDLQPLDAWSVLNQGGAQVHLSVESNRPLNSKNTRYLKMEVLDAGSKAGISNSGFDGIPINSGALYDFSVYLRKGSDFDGWIAVQLAFPNGVVAASDTIKDLGDDWEKFSLVLKSNVNIPAAQLLLTTNSTGLLYADMVSLFPQETFKGRANGLRADLAQAIADLKPRFLRFPGGCISHGRGLDNAYRWKDTVGDVAERKPNWNLWGYHQTYGLGFYEYFLFCEDINAIPLPVVPVGVSCQFREREIAPLSEMQMWVDDALDLIEFANGPIDSEWGAVRAQMGHPEPFNMEYICLGNEEDDIPEFRERFMMITDSIRKYHPEIKIIGTSGTDDTGSHYHSLWDFNHQNQIDVVDEHYYNDPSWFLENTARYDQFDRDGPKVFIGEYASWDDKLWNALAEAAFLTGVERNGDIIEFACYAPLCSNVDNQQWHPDLLRFNNHSVTKTASYYVQQLFSVHAGDTYYHSLVGYDDLSIAPQGFKGQTGVGTWNTQAEFSNFKISTDEEVLIEDALAAQNSWTVLAGSFTFTKGTYKQAAVAEPAWSLFNLPVMVDNYTISLRAKKTGGAEGFLIPLAYKNGDYYWFNIGGWGNTQHAVEKEINGQKSVLHSRAGSIQTNHWYDIRIEVKPNQALCYLDDVLLFTVPINTGPVFVSATLHKQSQEVILKIVNTASEALTAKIEWKGITAPNSGRLITLAGQPETRNAMATPHLLVPEEDRITLGGPSSLLLPATSFQVLRAPLSATTAIDAPYSTRKNSGQNTFVAFPNPAQDQIHVQIQDKLPGPYTLSLIHTEGQKVYQSPSFQAPSRSIPRNNLPPGLYILQLKTNEKVYQSKIHFK